MLAFRRHLEPTIASITFVSFILYVGLYCFKGPWGGDFDLYVAALRSLYANLLDPAHETLPLPGDYSHLFSPYIVGVAAAGQVLGISEYRALQYAGLLNLIFYTGAVLLFFRSFSLLKRSWYPPTLFLLISTLLYNDYYHWSSEMHLRTVVSTVAYPSFLAWAVALAAFALANDFLKGGRIWKLFSTMALVWFALLIHPLTASWIIGMLGILGLLSLAQDRRKFPRACSIYAAIVVGLLATFIWPYTSLVDVLGNALGLREVPPDVQPVYGDEPFLHRPFDGVLWMYLVALPCGAYLIFIRRHGFLLLGFISTFLTYLVLTHILGLGFAGRYVFFQAFFAQAAVSEVAALGPSMYWRSQSEWDRGLITRPTRGFVATVFSSVVIVLVVFAPATWDAFSRQRLKPPWALIRAESASGVYYGRFAEWSEWLGPADVLMASVDSPAEAIAAVTGTRLVASRHALAAPDYYQRIHETHAFFAADATMAERQTLIERHGVTWILLWYPGAEMIRSFEGQFGAAALTTDQFVLFRAVSVVEIP